MGQGNTQGFVSESKYGMDYTLIIHLLFLSAALNQPPPTHSLITCKTVNLTEHSAVLIYNQCVRDNIVTGVLVSSLRCGTEKGGLVTVSDTIKTCRNGHPCPLIAYW